MDRISPIWDEGRLAYEHVGGLRGDTQWEIQVPHADTLLLPPPRQNVFCRIRYDITAVHYERFLYTNQICIYIFNIKLKNIYLYIYI